MILKLLQKLKPIDLFVFIALLLAIVTITVKYVSSENYIFFGDFIKYSDKLDVLIDNFKVNPLKSIKIFFESLGEDYTDIPCILLLPFRLIFGASRLSFVLSLSLSYILPFCLITGYVSTQIIPIYPRAVFWLSAFFCILTPATWVAIFRGFPDLAGMSIVVLSMLIYWKTKKVKRNIHAVQIAAICAFSVLFRRYFVYSVRALFLTIVIFVLFEYILKIQKIKDPLFSDKFKRKLWKIFKLLTKKINRESRIIFYFLLFSPVLLVKVISINYRIRYASYEFPFSMGFAYYVDAYGWLIFGLSILGYLVGLSSNFLSRSRTIFVSLFGFISIIQWCLTAKQIGVQYSTNFTFFVILGLSSLFWTIWSKTNNLNRLSLIAIQLSTLIFNGLLGLTTIAHSSGGYRNAFAVSSPPMIRRDLPELYRLIYYLHKINPQRKPIYVGASSYSFNYGIPLSWAISLSPPIKLPILRPPDIDSRDFYPLNRVLRSHFVIIASPFQHHVLPQEQMTVKTVLNTFNQNWLFAKDFQKLPQKFSLDNNVTVEIYERVSPASFQTILDTLNRMRQEIRRLPAEEPYWITLSSEETVEITHNYGGRDVRFDSITLRPNQTSSFLYFGTIPLKSHVHGKIIKTTCLSLEKLKFQLSALDENGNAIYAQSLLVEKPNKPQKFSFFASKKNAKYLRLDLMNPDRRSLNSECQIYLDGITIDSVN